ncbi:hypothetical protein ABEF92_004919 [Exophiala dermatitidis]|uniref:Uncharacterized protein n=1 Tax=Exophiala dermatitidis (strain ATCC 34100 / CBS 525.76 / NIH/UT8656) TaxID=858893 RepID=H6BWW2_EXODN|nr:uncharacterized protein HMPREF1120_04216 [Exophiala dermatitidis NIH/UT8656]EHY56118.1 hypothetical protein HMPREF1120_04216 [Exophiala dermatitidis NIH/UT8656]
MGFSSALFAAAQPTPTPAAEPTTTESSSSLRSEDTHDDGHGNATTSPDKSAGAGKYNAYTYIYPWLGPDYTNGNISFETQFQDWEIENPAIALQEMLGERVRVRGRVRGLRRFVGAIFDSRTDRMSKR